MESQIVSQCNLLEIFAETPEERVELALQAMREGNGVLVVDDENRENEGDISPDGNDDSLLLRHRVPLHAGRKNEATGITADGKQQYQLIRYCLYNHH